MKHTKTPAILCLTIICIVNLFSVCAKANSLPTFKFKRLTTVNGLPSNTIQKIYQGRDGYIWMASQNGLFQYDGHTIRSFKSNLHHADMLSHNNLHCLEEDRRQRLWIGAYKGLNMLDKKTGQVHQINRKEFINNSISSILVTKDDRLLIGSDQGLYQYVYETDSCILIGKQNTGGVFPETTIKTLVEDSRGNIWIGTWGSGLFRYNPDEDKYYAYPQMNSSNSAHVIFEDSRGRIWIGTWGAGVHLLENQYDMQKVTWKTFFKENGANQLMHNIIYDISEDLNTQTIWIGTPRGLSILTDEANEHFVNYYPDSFETTISHSELNSIIRDNQGMMWLGFLGGGVNTVITRKPYFKSYPLAKVRKELNTNTISSLYVDDAGLLWIGIGNNGVMCYNRDTDQHSLFSQIEGLNTLPYMSSVVSISHIPSRNQLWMGAYNTGVYVYEKQSAKNATIAEYNPGNVPWLSGGQVFAIHEDSKNNIWLGTNYGPTMLAPDNHYIRFDSLEFDGKMLRSAIITDIKEGEADEIWLASNNYGAFRLAQRYEVGEDSYSLYNYSISNGKLNSTNISYMYKDSKNRIWACSEGSGLNLYDRRSDSFIPVHKNWNLPGDAVFNMVEDEFGNLWLGTNSGLIKLNISDDNLGNASFRLYTTSDGLLDNSFTRGSLFRTREGEIFIGGRQGLNSFFPSDVTEDASFLPPIVITDIKIHNCSWIDLEEKVRLDISPFTPGYTEAIKLNYRNNNFNIEFASLGYETPGQHTYAYKLEGFDSRWQYTDASRRFAYYNNLTPGTYTFSLKATNANGVWNNEVRTLQVTILPPPWKTWWAYLIYTTLAVATIVFVYRMISNRIKLRNALQLREMEKEKAEELNHAKLQFFTNITHELLTPLSIISASVDELKKEAPRHEEKYKVMTHHINRLIRLLQQILEFRKAETGNLKLRVSQGDLAAFVSNSVESFRPLIRKKQMNFSVSCQPMPFPAWFDPDKLDKILYNLLSNAAKYNNPGGNICVKLCSDENDYAIITVEDDGQGISREAQQNLFRRFYEGDYRKFKTIGTGIGLSLTRDLVVLHGGTISVESEEGKGTLFKIVIPVQRRAFRVEEIDETIADIQPSAPNYDTMADADAVEPEELPADNHAYTILLIEDNEDLLQLMVKLLGAEYSIFTATNGQEGLDVIRSQDIDLVVSDIMMPVMDGVAFCREVKNNLETSHIPVLLLTAKTGEADRVDAYQSGADAYLNKPFNLSILHARINNLLRARERTGRDFKKQLVFEAKELNYTSLDEEFLQKAIDCIHRHLDDPDYDQSRFVEDMGTSRSTLFRKMKSLTGMSYVSFIRNVRLKAACRIMEEKKNVRISELAYAVGFNDPRYFSTCFKKEFGMQPREYFEKYVQTEKE
ncbi:response regulator [Bacteroides sp. OttesenSCG-928-J23]|nr:response regulator [Bacteroides sp. OttesenSCG-928-N06]MDL2247817.1 response regulator [Bacteroides sp. OttesenSCG-928-J23]